MTTGQGQKVKGHKVTHKKFTLSRALALVTLESRDELGKLERRPVEVQDFLIDSPRTTV